MKRRQTYNPNHPLATRSGSIKSARVNLWKKLGGKEAPCYWCKLPLLWMKTQEQNKVKNALCVDHLDRNSTNDKFQNLVPSCRQCNANRHTNGRRKLRECRQCLRMFLPGRRTTIFCSLKCLQESNKDKKRGTTASPCAATPQPLRQARRRYVQMAESPLVPLENSEGVMVCSCCGREIVGMPVLESGRYYSLMHWAIERAKTQTLVPLIPRRMRVKKVRKRRQVAHVA